MTTSRKTTVRPYNVGLPAAGPRNALRPKFADVTVKPGDLLAHQRVNLWGSGYSSRGYRETVTGVFES